MGWSRAAPPEKPRPCRPDEHRRVIETTVEVARGRVPVIAGCGSNNTAHAIELTKAAKEAGADAALHVPPYYNRPNQEGIYAHLAAVADLGIPIILYNVPSRTITDIAVETMAQIVAPAECDRASRMRPAILPACRPSGSPAGRSSSS